MSTLDWILAILNAIVYVLAHMNGRNQGLARATKVLESYHPPQPERLTAAEWAERTRGEEINAREGKAPSEGPRF